MDSEMADDAKAEIVGDEAADEEQLLAEDSEMAEAGPEGEAEHVKTEEELEEELKETKITIPRYSPHTMPDWKLDDMRSRWPWHVRIYPIDQEDCRNCILDTVTKISQEAWYYVPKRKVGEGIAELCMSSDNEARTVMGRIVRMPFYHNYVTLEITKKKKEEGSTTYNEIEESATIVFDTTKCEKIKNTAPSKGGVKRKTLWVRYLSEDTTPEFLRVVFPFAQTAQVHTHEELRIAEVRNNSKTDVLLFMKGYLTVVINNKHILALQNKELGDNEQAIKEELEKSVTPVESLEIAPTAVAERTEQTKYDKNLSAGVLKRTLQQQQKLVDAKRKDPMMRNRSGEPPAKRGGRGNWGDRFDGRRPGGGGGGRYGGGGGGGGGYPGGPIGMPYGGPRGGYGGGGGGGGMLDPHGMAAEMMMMQAQLNQTIQNQLMMLNPGGGGGGGGGGGYGGRKDGRRGGGGRGGGGRKGGW